MAARKNSRNNSGQKSLPWGPMLISFMVGVFVMFLMELNDNVIPENSNTKTTKTPIKVIEPIFEFYSVLPEMEVVVHDKYKPRSNSTIQDENPVAAKKAEDNANYLLQVGSFRKLSDADGFKARLAFLGLESKVQTVTIDNKDTWHRVQVGPIVGREKADSVKEQLKKNKIDSLLVRIKHG